MPGRIHSRLCYMQSYSETHQESLQQIRVVSTHTSTRGKEMRKVEIDREILEDYVKRGLSQMEMAVELNITQATVSARL